jgi:hypothetical protein
MKALKTAFKSFFFIVIVSVGCLNEAKANQYAFDFYGNTFNFEADSSTEIPFNEPLANASVKNFYNKLNAGHYQSLIAALQAYKTKYQLNDWLYYQLIRKTAQELSPKAANYSRYTLYKWFLLSKSGYDAKIAIGNNQIIFYVRTDEDISDIPFFNIDQKRYICLNYHDYGKLFERENVYKPVSVKIDEATTTFSYKVTRMPDFNLSEYHEKQIVFNYKHKSYHFNVKVTDEVSTIFANYPVVDYGTYFNIPLSKATYESLVPILKANTKKMSIQNGVDYLMRFTRYAFLYEDDEASYGKEKRNSPEQTLLSDQSDCDDRAALFFYLVKEIYDLPMIALLYPTHLTMAVQFDKPIGNAIDYKGKKYTVCEPTPQKQPLKLGELSSNLKDRPYEIVYAYEPTLK